MSWMVDVQEPGRRLATFMFADQDKAERFAAKKCGELSSTRAVAYDDPEPLEPFEGDVA